MNIKIGTQIGNWEVISEKYLKNNIYWNDCQCICGTVKSVRTWHLNNSKSKSCGCNNVKGRFKSKSCGDLSASYYTSFKYSRVAKGLEFSDELTMEYLWELFNKQNKKCAISNINIYLNPRWSQQNKGKPTKIIQTASIDRIDNSLGYIVGNVQWVHKDINYMRGGLSIEHFISFCKQVALNNSCFNCEHEGFSEEVGKRKYFKGK